jgi:hypothetical protein
MIKEKKLIQKINSLETAFNKRGIKDIRNLSIIHKNQENTELLSSWQIEKIKA